MGTPVWSRCWRASMALARAAWLRARAAAIRWAVLSAGIGGTVCLEGFEGGDDGVEAVLDPAQVVGEAEASVGLGLGDQPAIGGCLGAVDGKELRCGLEIGAGQTGVGVGTVAPWWSAAVAVGEAVGDTGQVVFDPLGVGGRRFGVIG